MKTKRVLPADVYDTLEFSAIVYGGIGRDSLRGPDAEPCCIYGHAVDAAGSTQGAYATIASALAGHGIGALVNDRAVFPDRRISFREWCRRLNVVRGAA